ncbi:hypothetical protein QBC38DRAFT_478753 [Podospora fimiseda]|uniref:Uncharacterized protein n=1 Tax=Podospora fimiseda TaxID=252190 RepID=A0AAN7BPA0_9PEZI|nr:hypothetical protein QBC38DRAFT_478753 [Podospora fimiseda]
MQFQLSSLAVLVLGATAVLAEDAVTVYDIPRHTHVQPDPSVIGSTVPYPAFTWRRRAKPTPSPSAPIHSSSATSSADPSIETSATGLVWEDGVPKWKGPFFSAPSSADPSIMPSVTGFPWGKGSRKKKNRPWLDKGPYFSPITTGTPSTPTQQYTFKKISSATSSADESTVTGLVWEDGVPKWKGPFPTPISADSSIETSAAGLILQFPPISADPSIIPSATGFSWEIPEEEEASPIPTSTFCPDCADLEYYWPHFRWDKYSSLRASASVSAIPTSSISAAPPAFILKREAVDNDDLTDDEIIKLMKEAVGMAKARQYMDQWGQMSDKEIQRWAKKIVGIEGEEDNYSINLIEHGAEAKDPKEHKKCLRSCTLKMCKPICKTDWDCYRYRCIGRCNRFCSR